MVCSLFASVFCIRGYLRGFRAVASPSMDSGHPVYAEVFFQNSNKWPFGRDSNGKCGYTRVLALEKGSIVFCTRRSAILPCQNMNLSLLRPIGGSFLQIGPTLSLFYFSVL